MKRRIILDFFFYFYQLAHLEAKDITAKNSFGKHEKYEEWEKTIRNENVLEIAMELTISAF